MKRFEEPKVEVRIFEVEDVITASGDVTENPVSNDLVLPDKAF